MATSGRYLLFKGPAFFIEIYRYRERDAKERAEIFEGIKDVEEFTYKPKKVNRRDLIRRLTIYLHQEGLAVHTSLRVDGEERKGQVFQRDIEVEDIVSGVLGTWDEGRPRKRAENFLRRFLVFPRRTHPRTVRQMWPFVFSKTTWANLPTSRTPTKDAPQKRQ